MRKKGKELKLNFKKIFLLISCIVFIPSLFALPSELTIQKLYSEYRVNKNAEIDVTEDYNIYFPDGRGYHGFYRYLPLKGFDGRKLHIFDFESSQPIYSIEDYNGEA